MPDEMSPEEKLLRLIKGDKKTAEPQSKPAPGNNGTKTAENKETPAVEKAIKQNKPPIKKVAGTNKKTVDAKPSEQPKKSPAQIDNAIKKNLAEDKNLKTFKSSLKKKEPGTLKKINPTDKVEEKTSAKKTVPTTKPIPVVKKTEPEAKQKQTEKPQKTEPETKPEQAQEQTDKTEDKQTRPKENIFVHSFRFFISGFSVICWLLLLILFLSIGATFWHMRELSLQEYTVPDVSVETQTETQTETNIYLPKPFPYFAEQISSKKLFRLVKPPPPPKPPEPEKKEPEKPTIKIETLTRHFVLQGIVYDIGPPQAIIFNKKDNKTMFLGNKEMLNDSVKIKKILRGKVILEYEDQTQEMTF